jgi:hypothetical protein
LQSASMTFDPGHIRTTDLVSRVRMLPGSTVAPPTRSGRSKLRRRRRRASQQRNATSGGVGNVDLVTVAVVPDPRHAIPLHGTFIGFPSDHLGMEVQVSVMSGAPKAIGNAPRPSARRQIGQSA